MLCVWTCIAESVMSEIKRARHLLPGRLDICSFKHNGHSPAVAQITMFNS
jgi:hypothetical protein